MALVYQNPVFAGYFADPFVLRCGEAYFAYGTGEPPAERAGAAAAFDVLRSPDLVHWTRIGAALPLGPDEAHRSFWAPEVAAHAGRFYLFYSSAPANRDELHRLRVAVASDPAGPFVPAGAVLPETDGFSIDAHPFQDPRDGRWYLYFAKDFFDERAGTGLAVVPLTDDLLRAAGPAQTVLRANHDWQIYERNRPLYEKMWAEWHTVEGPCVVVHDGRYFCFYSGGNWQTRDYGVSYAVAEHPLGPWRHAEASGPIVLQQRLGEVLGPGHNSYILAPDGRTELLVYHAWDVQRSARRMCLDRLVWTKDGPRCLGPTTTPQTLIF
jgi:GH43 family beta-xylosidase